ncbi:ribonuclease R [[Clostridium] saccharolyticum WM1]|uniref:Ribonuclease R n=2 Tax=Lacrimispora TaxID=2719231 RepID=D9R2E0_LACSW|nr:ribonuclease R [Lacrimispora saccharolytica]ADL04790.1 ribonuclease R [[Clostridium] saccharolyticum WM1]
MTEEQLIQRKAMLLQLFEDPAYAPMKLKELAMLFDIPKEQREDLKEVLDTLLTEGKIGISQKGKYGKPDLGSIAGVFFGHPKGFGFVAVEGLDQDIFIPEDKTGGALHGDTVLVSAETKPGNGKRAEGHVVKVLEHANEQIIGYYQKNKSFGFVIPDNQKISKDVFIPQGKDMGAMTGHKVVVKVTDYGGPERKPEGVITEILGHVNDPGTDILSIVRAYGLPEEFPDSVMKQVTAVPDEITGKDMQGRLDLRDLQTVTIDGEDAKDLDDAITISKKGGVYTLGVHIADVTNYVTENSPLDEEALRRGTSVYLVDRVIPMLPHKLSNGICSLNQGEDRLALSCIMDIDEDGSVIGHRIAETVINVDRRMTYTAVNAIITDRDESVRKEYEAFVPMFEQMKELADILREKRKKRGSIDFDFPETKVILDERGKPLEIKPYDRNSATKIIEDFMLMANETVAEDYFWQEIPFLYRTHDNPDPERMKSLATLINNFGYSIRFHNGEVYPKEVQKLLANAEDTPEEALISRLALRSMKQAKYTVANTGHFGLAAKYYTHFTSPIRRYPDLQIHRIIKENLRSGLSDKRISHYDKILQQVSVQSSAMERRADEAERETIKLKKCEYMSRHIGEEFDGVISGVTNWGLYVELPNTVEGLIHVNQLQDDYYHFDEEHYELVGEMTRKTYKLGQPIRVMVAGTDKLLRTIDFIPAKKFDEE